MLKKNANKKRIIIYIIYSLALFGFVFYLENIPNYQMGIGTNDYDIWLKYLYLPCVFVLHGIISSIILKCFKLYVPLLYTIIFSFVYTIATHLSTPSDIKSALFATVNYLLFTFATMIVCKATVWVYRKLKN